MRSKTKSEVDCMLAGKADRCVLEKHLIDPCAHQGGCQSGGCVTPNACDCACYSKEEIDDLLANRKITIHSIPFAAGLQDYNGNGYYKTNDGVAHCYLTCRKISGESFAGGDIICVLPEVYRPRVFLRKIVVLDTSPTGGRQLAMMVIAQDGTVGLSHINNAETNWSQAFIVLADETTFLAAD